MADRDFRRATIQQTPLRRWRHALVTAAENRHVASSFLQSAGKFFHNRSFPRAADGEVTDADDETAKGAFPENTFAIKKQVETAPAARK